MNAELRTAVETVLRDLDGPDGVQPDVREWPDSGTVDQVLGLFSADQTGMGVLLRPGLSGAALLADVADQVQEWAVEDQWGERRPTNLPPCPEHPQSHPLQPAADGDRAIWRCPGTGTEIAQIGRLR